MLKTRNLIITFILVVIVCLFIPTAHANIILKFVKPGSSARTFMSATLSPLKITDEMVQAKIVIDKINGGIIGPMLGFYTLGRQFSDNQISLIYSEDASVMDAASVTNENVFLAAQELNVGSILLDDDYQALLANDFKSLLLLINIDLLPVIQEIPKFDKKLSIGLRTALIKSLVEFPLWLAREASLKKDITLEENIRGFWLTLRAMVTVLSNDVFTKNADFSLFHNSIRVGKVDPRLAEFLEFTELMRDLSDDLEFQAAQALAYFWHELKLKAGETDPYAALLLDSVKSMGNILMYSGVRNFGEVELMIMQPGEWLSRIEAASEIPQGKVLRVDGEWEGRKF